MTWIVIAVLPVSMKNNCVSWAASKSGLANENAEALHLESFISFVLLTERKANSHV